jgi:ankyrin repeat protein
MITGLPSAESPLHWIVAFDDDDQKHATSLLMRAGAEVAADISWNHPLIDLPGKLPLGTPFHYATFFNNPSLLQELLHQSGEEHSARFANITGSSELTPLEYAARYHRYEIIQRLLENRACHDSGDSNTDALVLHEVSNLATYESWTIDGLLNLRPNEAAGLCTMVLLDWDASLLEQEDEIGATPLMTACYNHNRAVVKCLIERGCNVNARTPFEYDGRTALNLYSNNQLAYADDDILDLLYAENADLELGSASGMKPLHYAARDNNMRFAKRLLELGVQLDARTHRGLTPLHCAASYGATDVGQLLMDSKADLYAQSETGAPHEKNGSGLTPLAMAISQNQKEFIDLLLNDRYNLDPIAKPTSADTIIHFAITAHQPDILRRVLMFSKLKDKALLNRKNLKGVTALHLAAGSISRQEHIKLLIKAGADVNIVSCTGHTTLDIAHQTRELVRARINHGM